MLKIKTWIQFDWDIPHDADTVVNGTKGGCLQ